jgi:hypothetical protein
MNALAENGRLLKKLSIGGVLAVYRHSLKQAQQQAPRLYEAPDFSRGIHRPARKLRQYRRLRRG